MRVAAMILLFFWSIPCKAQYEYLLHKPYAERQRLLREINLDIVDAINGKNPAPAFARMLVIEDMARKAGDEELLLETQVMYAWLALQLDTANRQNSKYEKELLTLLDKAQAIESVPIEITIRDRLGNYYYNYVQKYNKAFEQFLVLYQKVKDIPVTVMPEKYNYICIIGASYYHFGDDDNALRYLYTAKEGIDKHGGEVWCTINTYNTIGLVFRNAARYDSAIYYFRLAAQESAKYKIDTWVDVAEGNIGITYFLQGKYDEAIPLLEKDVHSSITDGSPGNATNSILKLAEIYLDRKDTKKAAYLLSRADSFIHLANKQYLYYHTLYRLHALRNKLDGNLAEAYHYASLALTAKDTLAARMNANILVRNENELQAALHAAAVQKMEADAARLNMTRNYLAVFVAALAVILVLLVNRQRLKQKQHMVEAQRAEDKLAAARKQLKEFTLRIQEKKDLIEQFTAEIENLQAAQATQDLPETNEHLLQLQQATILTDEQWTDFKQLFEQVYAGFLDRAYATIPNLTQAEARFLALGKLKLSNREMAGILGVSAQAVRNYKYRIRKKLNLSEEGDIDEVIDSI